MGCGASVENDVQKVEEKLDEKIENLEDEMRDIQFEINKEQKIVDRLKTQHRTQEAARHLSKIKLLQEKLERTRHRVNKTDSRKEFLDKRLDTAEDIKDSEFTKKVAESIKIDFNAALKTEDSLNEMNERMNVYDEMVNKSVSPNEEQIMTALTDDIKKKQVVNAPPEKKKKIDKTTEGYQTMQLIVEKVRLSAWIEVNQLCDKCISLNHDLLQSYSFKGKAQFYLEAYNDAIISFSKALENADKENFLKRGKLFYIRGKSYDSLGKKDKAMEDYLSCIKEDTKNWRALFEIGKLYNENGKKDLAINYLKKAYTFSSYKCREANELIKKINEKESIMDLVETKEEEKKEENWGKNKIDKSVLRKLQFNQNRVKYIIQSVEIPQRVLTVNPNPQRQDGSDEIVLFNRVGNAQNQLWYYDNGVFETCIQQGKKYLNCNQNDWLILTENVSTRFFMQNKYIVSNITNKVIDIREFDNPNFVLLEMDFLGKGQRYSQYWRVLSLEMEKQNQQFLEMQKKQQQKRLQEKISKMENANIKNNQNFVQNNLSSLLQHSMTGNFQNVMDELKNFGTDNPHPAVNDIDPKTGNSVLINAIAYNNLNAVTELLKCGANPLQGNTYNLASPLHFCVSWKRYHMILLLRSAGGNPLQIDRYGMNCFHYVQKFAKGDKKMLDLLRRPIQFVFFDEANEEIKKEEVKLPEDVEYYEEVESSSSSSSEEEKNDNQEVNNYEDEDKGVDLVEQIMGIGEDEKDKGIDIVEEVMGIGDSDSD